MSKRKRDYLLFLEDIADAILRIEEYTNGMSFKKSIVEVIQNEKSGENRKL